MEKEVPEEGLEPSQPCGHWILNPKDSGWHRADMVPAADEAPQIHHSDIILTAVR
jgi:hypothetical protein